MEIQRSASSSAEGTYQSRSTDLAELIRTSVEHATLAPSGHNTQPWKFRIGESFVDIFADRTRALPVVDPYDRELTISCGAAIAFFEIAASNSELATDVTYQPDAEDPDHLARISIEPGPPPDTLVRALFAAIPDRCTDRTAYTMEPLPADVAEICSDLARKLGQELHVIESGEERSAIAALVAEGDRIQFEYPRFRRELASWVHSARLVSQYGMSGAAFGMPDVLSSIGRLVIRTFDIGNGVAAADEKKIVSGSPALVVFGSPNDDIPDWLNTGRTLAKILLCFASRGLSASYLNQPIETESLRPMLKGSARVAGHPQILLRVGYSNSHLSAAVRRDLSDMLVSDQ